MQLLEDALEGTADENALGRTADREGDHGEDSLDCALDFVTDQDPDTIPGSSGKNQVQVGVYCYNYNYKNLAIHMYKYKNCLSFLLG